jgi:fibronectin-binding autotransporter adhesin
MGSASNLPRSSKLSATTFHKARNRRRLRATCGVLTCLASAATSTAPAAITPTGSTSDDGTFYKVGVAASGTLTIDGGSVLTRSWCQLSTGFGGYNATATVTGAGSKLATSFTEVGIFGPGILSIQNGGQVTDTFGLIGELNIAGSSATVSGSGSLWANSTDLELTAGTLTVSDGGLVTAPTLYASLANINGNGTISVNGIVLDNDVTRDSAHGAEQVFHFGSVGTLNVNLNGSGFLGAGNSSTGSLTIPAGLAIASNSGLIGWHSGSGAVTVTGAGATWSIASSLYVGGGGSGKLTVSNGGLVTANTLYGSLADLSGNGTVTITGGAILDGDLVFDSTHGATQTIPFGTGGALNLTVSAASPLGLGYKGKGTLAITDGKKIASSSGYLGYNSGSNGSATITGPGSTWTINPNTSLYVGNSGKGALTIQSGGTVSSYLSYLGYNSGSNGAATVSGNASTWTNTSDLYVGYSGVGTLLINSGGHATANNALLGYSSSTSIGTATVTGAGSTWTITTALNVGTTGSGKLTVADAAKVTASSLSVGSNSSRVNLDVNSSASTLVLGNATTAGRVTNNGTINFYAGPALDAGTYTPIADLLGRAMTWSGIGSYKATGGTWDTSAHTFTVPASTPLTSGSITTLTSGQRLLITDSPSGQTVGASFGPITGSPLLAAAPMSSAELALLAVLPGFNDHILQDWDFTTNLPSGSDVLLSFNVGPGYDPATLHLWHLSSNTWTPFTPSWQTYSFQGLLDFPVTSFSGYAVTVAVPEPLSLPWLTLAAAATFHRHRRNRKQNPFQVPSQTAPN